MKKAIITTAILLSATLSFYAKQTTIKPDAEILKRDKLSMLSNFDQPFKKSCRMDIGQADMSN